MKTIDWSRISTNPMDSKTNPRKSGREMLQKAFHEEKQQEVGKDIIKKAWPVMEELFKIRLTSPNSKFVVNRPLNFQGCTFEKGLRGDGKFVDRGFTLPPGTELMLKSIDRTMKEFVFEDQKGEEVAIPFMAKNELLLKTDIYEISKEFIGE